MQDFQKDEKYYLMLKIIPIRKFLLSLPLRLTQ